MHIQGINKPTQAQLSCWVIFPTFFFFFKEPQAILRFQTRGRRVECAGRRGEEMNFTVEPADRSVCRNDRIQGFREQRAEPSNWTQSDRGSKSRSDWGPLNPRVAARKGAEDTAHSVNCAKCHACLRPRTQVDTHLPPHFGTAGNRS